MSAAGSRVFRKAALDRLADPEQLDEALRIVRPRDALAAMMLVALVAAGVSWLFLGKVKTLVPASGIFAPADGTIVQVSAPSEGTLATLLVSTGDSVALGQPIAQISQPELMLELAQVRAAVQDLATRNSARSAQIDERAQIRQERLAARLAALEEQQVAANRRLAAQQDQVARDEALLDRGLIIARVLDESRRQLDDARQALRDIEAARAGVESEALAADQQDDLDRAALADELRALESRAEQLDLRAREQRAVLAPAAGRVKEVLVRPGERVAPGMRLATLETGNEPVRLVAYVAPEQGKAITPGMEVLVVPSTVRRAETGGLRARVINISAAPVTPQAMLAVLGNEALLPRLAPFGAPFEVVIALDRDPAEGTPIWAAGQGPALQLDSGTLATAEITQRIDPPITLVMPALRAVLGFDGAAP